MKVLVIGGTRFFGKRLVKMLIEQDDDVTVLSRGLTPDPFGGKVKRIHADRTSVNELRRQLQGQSFDAVVDQICFTGQEAREAIEAFTGKIEYYVMTSTMSVYRPGAHLKETDFDPLSYVPRPPQDPGEAYAEGKRAAEKEFLTMATFPVAFARFPVVLGEDDYTRRLFDHVKAVQEGRPIYLPELSAHFSFIHAEDAARSLCWLLAHEKAGAYNFAAPDHIELGELVRKIEFATGRKAKLVNDPTALSSFGTDVDCYLETGKALSEGFECWRLSEWLYKLIEYYVKK